MSSKNSQNDKLDLRRGFPEGLEMFDILEDPRSSNATLHPFGSLIFIALSAIICGMDTCEDFVRFAKTLRGSRKADESTVQIVSAWAQHNGLTLAPQAVDKKSNEITAVPKLLRLLNLQGVIVTLDAMGAQRKIAIEIIRHGAGYLLALKGNQETLHNEVKAFFGDPESLKYAESKGAVVETVEDYDKGHGRIEKRVCTVTDYLDWLPAKVRRDCLGLRSLVRVETQTALSNGSERRETRYYLSSMSPDAAHHLDCSRKHWGVENSCHWVLDVVFREDQSRARSGDCAQNLSTLRRFALNLLKTEPSKPKEPIRGKRIYAVLDQDYLESIIGLAQV